MFCAHSEQLLTIKLVVREMVIQACLLEKYRSITASCLLSLMIHEIHLPELQMLCLVVLAEAAAENDLLRRRVTGQAPPEGRDLASHYDDATTGRDLNAWCTNEGRVARYNIDCDLRAVERRNDGVAGSIAAHGKRNLLARDAVLAHVQDAVTDGLVACDGCGERGDESSGESEKSRRAHDWKEVQVS